MKYTVVLCNSNEYTVSASDVKVEDGSVIFLSDGEIEMMVPKHQLVLIKKEK